MQTPHTPRVGSESTCADSCIRLASGALIDLADPDPALLSIKDIAQSLAKTVRFSGHCPLQPTVAQHSLAVERIASVLWRDEHRVTANYDAPRGLRRAALMHDAAEALVGDLAGPAKRWLRRRPEVLHAGYLSSFDVLEVRAEAAVAKRFGIDFDRYAHLVHEADVEAYRFEVAYQGWSDTRPAAWVDNDAAVWRCYGFLHGRVRTGHVDGGEFAFLSRYRRLGIA